MGAEEGGGDELLWLELSFKNPDCPFISTTEDYPGIKINYVKGFEENGHHNFRVRVDGDDGQLEDFLDEIYGVEGCEAIDVLGRNGTALCQGTFTGAKCIREVLNDLDVTVEQIEIHGGRGYAGTHLPSHDMLRSVLSEISGLSDVRLEDVSRQGNDSKWPDDVFLDGFGLTEKQFRALERAYEMGYFDVPRRANATQVAQDLDITISTVMDHLQKALSKMLGNYFEGVPKDVEVER